MIDGAIILGKWYYKGVWGVGNNQTICHSKVRLVLLANDGAETSCSAYYKETGQDRKGELASKPLNINKIKNI